MFRVLQGSAEDLNRVLIELENNEDTVEVLESFTDVLVSNDFPEEDKVVVTMVLRITPMGASD